MIDMIGVGPFITIPLIIAAAGGPQAMLGWILGAVFALCDGLVWAELGAAMPERRRIVSLPERNLRTELAGTFVVVPLHLAAVVQRAALDRLGLHRLVPLCGISVAGPRAHDLPRTRFISPTSVDRHPRSLNVLVMPATWVAIATCAVRACCSIGASPWLASWRSCCGSASRSPSAWVIFAGLTHFSAARAFDFPPGAFTLSPGILHGHWVRPC